MVRWMRSREYVAEDDVFAIVRCHNPRETVPFPRFSPRDVFVCGHRLEPLHDFL